MKQVIMMFLLIVSTLLSVAPLYDEKNIGATAQIIF